MKHPLKPEKEPSLFARISTWLHVLHDMAGSFWESWPFLLSKVAAPFKEFAELISGKHHTENKRAGFPKKSDVVPTTPTNEKTEQCGYPRAPRWKTTAEIIGIGIASGLLIVNIFALRATKKAADAAKNSVDIADAALQMSQRAYVTIGRKDGVVADFVVPKDPTQNAEIVIYFQNTGHLPAKFAWGATAPFLAVGSKKPSSGINFVHPFKGLPIRTKDIKTGTIGEQGESTTVAGDSVFVSTLGIISQKDLAELPTNNMGLLILGFLAYCDELGTNSYRTFGLRYRSNAPSSSLSFDLAEDFAMHILPLPEPTATTEYLPPCETFREREKQKKTNQKTNQ